MMFSRSRAFCSVALFLVFAPLSTADAFEREPDRAMWRFEFDNDVTSNSDDAYSGGWSLQRHGPASETWEELDRNRFSLFVARSIPGLGDDGGGGRVVRTGLGLSQIIQTPVDITNPEPQPADVPWAGVLGVHWTWSAMDNRRLNAFQVFVGCMGPCSGAEQVQRFVHEDLGMGDPPLGWDHQLDNTALLNFNYVARRKLLAPLLDRYESPRFNGDVSVGGQVGLGNFFRLADIQLEARFGWSLPPGFTHIPDPPGRGVMLDASPCLQPKRWAFYVSVVPRVVYFEHVATLDGGDTANGGHHPGIDFERTHFEVLIGLHLTRGKFALHVTHYLFRGDVFGTSTTATLDWTNLSVQYRF